MYLMGKITCNLFLFINVIVMMSCETQKEENVALEVFRNYYSAIKEDSDERWNYTSDTVEIWFDDKEGTPSLRIKGKESTGKWQDWDVEMNSTSWYDSLWYDRDEEVIQGYFFENNDFYELIGKSPTKTLRTYWLNENNKIDEILIYWIPEENTPSSEHLNPIVEWALENDSTEITELYPNGAIIPSKENAIRWKKLLSKYNDTLGHN